MGSGNTPLPTTAAGSHALSVISGRAKKRETSQSSTTVGSTKRIHEKSSTYNSSKQEDQAKNEEDGSTNGENNASHTTENSVASKVKKA